MIFFFVVKFGIPGDLWIWILGFSLGSGSGIRIWIFAIIDLVFSLQL